jgi:hypothetical protein
MEPINNDTKLLFVVVVVVVVVIVVVVVAAIKTLTIRFTILFGPCMVIFGLLVRT